MTPRRPSSTLVTQAGPHRGAASRAHAPDGHIVVRDRRLELLESAPDAMVVTDAGGTIVWVNAAIGFPRRGPAAARCGRRA